MFSQLPNISGGRLVHPQHENAFPNPRVVGPPPAYSVYSRLHSIRGGRLVRLPREKQESVCCVMRCDFMFDTWRALLWSSAFLATRVHGSVTQRLEGGGQFVHPAHHATGKPNAVFSNRMSCFSVKSVNLESEIPLAFLYFLAMCTSSVINVQIHFLLTVGS